MCVCVQIYVHIYNLFFVSKSLLFIYCLLLESINTWDHMVFVFLCPDLFHFTGCPQSLQQIPFVHVDLILRKKKYLCMINWYSLCCYLEYDQESLFTFRTFEYNSSHTFNCKSTLRHMCFCNWPTYINKHVLGVYGRVELMFSGQEKKYS